MFLVGKPEGKRPHGRPRRRWEDNIRMNFREIESKAVDLVHLARDRNVWLSAVDVVKNILVKINCWESVD